MDVSKISQGANAAGGPGKDEVRRPAPPQQNRAGGSSGGTEGSTSATPDGTTRTSDPAAPQGSGAVLASTGAESGATRDGADQRQTRDRAPDAEEITARLRERFDALAKEARLPTNTRLSIDFDGETPRFRVVNKESGDVIREIPEQEFVDLLRRAGGTDGLVDSLF